MKAVSVLLLVVFVLLAAPAMGQQTPNFAGKTVTLVIGYGPGSGNDVYGRLIARHLGKHIPGQPTVVAQNQPGAGSFKAANYLFASAPKDGSTLGYISQTAATLCIHVPTLETSAPDQNMAKSRCPSARKACRRPRPAGPAGAAGSGVSSSTGASSVMGVSSATGASSAGCSGSEGAAPGGGTSRATS